MRNKIAAIFLLLTVMAVLPVAVVKLSGKAEVNLETASYDSVLAEENKSVSKANNEEIICGLTAALCKNEYSDETIKAITILMNTNYLVSPDSFDLSDNSIFLSEESTDSSSKELYSKVKNIYNSNKEIYIKKNSEILYIPYSPISNGYTVKNDSYNYLSAVASPWDVYSVYYDEYAECSGVSIEGIDYLCKNRLSSEDALKWYLPNFTIE